MVSISAEESRVPPLEVLGHCGLNKVSKVSLHACEGRCLLSEIVPATTSITFKLTGGSVTCVTKMDHLTLAFKRHVVSM